MRSAHDVVVSAEGGAEIAHQEQLAVGVDEHTVPVSAFHLSPDVGEHVGIRGALRDDSIRTELRPLIEPSLRAPSAEHRVDDRLRGDQTRDTRVHLVARRLLLHVAEHLREFLREHD